MKTRKVKLAFNKNVSQGSPHTLFSPNQVDKSSTKKEFKVADSKVISLADVPVLQIDHVFEGWSWSEDAENKDKKAKPKDQKLNADEELFLKYEESIKERLINVIAILIEETAEGQPPCPGKGFNGVPPRSFKEFLQRIVKHCPDEPLNTLIVMCLNINRLCQNKNYWLHSRNMFLIAAVSYLISVKTFIDYSDYDPPRKGETNHPKKFAKFARIAGSLKPEKLKSLEETFWRAINHQPYMPLSDANIKEYQDFLKLISDKDLELQRASLKQAQSTQNAPADNPPKETTQNSSTFP